MQEKGLESEKEKKENSPITAALHSWARRWLVGKKIRKQKKEKEREK